MKISLHIFLAGYNGKNKLDGNNANRFLSKVARLEECDWFPMELSPVLDVLIVFSNMKNKCFSWELQTGWAESIQLYSHMYAELKIYSETILGLPLSVTWKIHSIVCHLEPFLNEVCLVYVV